MDGMIINNKVELCGLAVCEATFSHKSRDREFYTLPMEICRLSGTVDRVNVTASRELLPEGLRQGMRLRVTGELRSFNNRSGTGSRLVISVFARELHEDEGEDMNEVLLSGTLCRRPNYRRTPMGREICDLMLAVNRRYSRSDYLPCIAWGQNAVMAQYWDVGERITLRGRLQSRKYIKTEDGQSVEKTAFEVSIVELLDEAGSI